MNHNAPIPVVAAVVRAGGRYLLGKRPSGKRHGGSWEFPGGKLHDGETFLDAARRELAEELSMKVVEVGPELFSAHDPGAPFEIHFVEVVATGEPAAREHEEVGWFGVGDLAALALAPADARFAAWLMQRDETD